MSRASNLAGFSTSVVRTSPNNLIVGVVTATSFYGDGSNLSNTGSTLGAASGSQRLVVTSQTSGTMTSAATDADLSWDSSTNTLSATNVSIAGTLTYEDVTNVDSIGIVTARAGAHVATVSGNLLVGSTTATGTGSQRLQVTGGAYVGGRLGVGLGIGVTNPKVSFQVSDNLASAPIPTLGIATGSLYVTNLDSAYGLLVGNGSNGNTWMQVQRTDSVATAYDLILQPSGGNVSIGTATAANALDVVRSSGEAVIGLKNTGTGSAWVSFTPGSAGGAYLHNTTSSPMIFTTNGTERARISSTGGFSVGTTAAPGSGAIFATGDITAFYSSDIRLKKDIQPISEPIKKLMEITGVTYKWNEEYLKDKEVDGYFVRETEVGVIAQEVEKVLPEVVATRENGYKAVRYEKLVALLIEAVKDQQHQIDELKARLEEK